MIYLAGGAPHQDMLDLKPNAPSEIRGEFDPIATSVPGIQISELMPRVASMMSEEAQVVAWPRRRSHDTCQSSMVLMKHRMPIR